MSFFLILFFFNTSSVFGLALYNHVVQLWDVVTFFHSYANCMFYAYEHGHWIRIDHFPAIVVI